jgi:hypothetical protein
VRFPIKSEIALIALEIQRTLENIDICSRNRNINTTGNIVLWANMSEAQQRRGQFRDRIVLVCDAEGRTVSCVGQVLRDAFETNLWCAIGIQIDSRALATQHASSKRRKRAAERVACCNNFVIRVLLLCSRYGSEHVFLCFEPRGPEAVACGARGADGGGERGEDEVCDPVADAAGAAEGEDDEFVGSVGGDEAGYIRGDAVFKFGQGVGGGGFDERAVSLGAGDLCVGRVVVGRAVGGGGVLAEELELGEEVGGYGW